MPVLWPTTETTSQFPHHGEKHHKLGGEPQRLWDPAVLPVCLLYFPSKCHFGLGVLWFQEAEQEPPSSASTAHAAGMAMQARWLWHRGCGEGKLSTVNTQMLSLALPGTYSQVQLCSQLPQAQDQRLKKEDVSGGFLSSFFASSDCEHRTSFKTTLEFNGEFHVFWTLWEDNYLVDKSSC